MVVKKHGRSSTELLQRTQLNHVKTIKINETDFCNNLYIKTTEPNRSNDLPPGVCSDYDNGRALSWEKLADGDESVVDSNGAQ